MKAWLRYPALFYAFASIAGISSFFGYFEPLIIGATAHRKTTCVGFFLVALFSFIETSLLYSPLPSQEILKGKGILQIKRITAHPSLYYSGTLECFVAKERIFYRIPCTFSVVQEDLLGDGKYRVQGTLWKAHEHFYKLRITHIEKIPGSYSLAKLRFLLKERLRAYLQQEISNKKSYALFASLATGDIESKYLRSSFSKVGLTHTLAISGFHYSALILCIGGLLRLFFSKWATSFLLVFIISFFFFFIGETPSLNRAWIGALIYLISYLIGRDGYGLNSLGSALLISLILDPFALLDIGFQLSYIATFGIFTLYPWINKLLQFAMPRRSLKTFQQMTRLHQIGYLLSLYIRKTAALTLAVNLVLLPLLLFHFGSFPLISLLYNLFFPLALLFAMICLILGILTPWIGSLFLKLGALYIHGFLEMVEIGALGFLGNFSHSSLTIENLVVFCLLLLFVGLALEDYRYELTAIEARM